jgi:Ca-activated chloride channel homolog
MLDVSSAVDVSPGRSDDAALNRERRSFSVQRWSIHHHDWKRSSGSQSAANACTASRVRFLICRLTGISFASRKLMPGSMAWYRDRYTRSLRVPKVDFAFPGLLLLALAVPPLVWWWLRRRRPALRFPAASLLVSLPAGRARKARLGGATMRGTALLMIVAAMAGPRTPDLRTRIDTEGIAIFMAVDVSGSMAERDFNWHGEPVSRLEAAKNVFRLFVEGGPAPGSEARTFEGRPTDLIGLVTFATRPETICPLTLSHSVLLKLLDEEQPRSVPGESETNLSDALAVGLQRLESAGNRRKVLVLLTDGEHNVIAPPSNWTPRQAAAVAAGLGVPIYTIDAGGSGTTTEDARPSDTVASTTAATREAAIASLKEIARVSGGRYFVAGDSDALLDACKKIDSMERAPITSFQYRRYHDLSALPGLAGFLLWATAMGLEVTLWRRLP